MTLIIAIDPSQAYATKSIGHVGFYRMVFDEYYDILDERCEQVLLESDKDLLGIIKMLEELKRGIFKQIHIVCEDYILYANKQDFQTYKSFPISELIGQIKGYVSSWKGATFRKQNAQLVKKTFADRILEHRKVITKQKNRYILTRSKKETTKHERDAIRHGQYFYYLLRDSRR